MKLISDTKRMQKTTTVPNMKIWKEYAMSCKYCPYVEYTTCKTHGITKRVKRTEILIKYLQQLIEKIEFGSKQEHNNII